MTIQQVAEAAGVSASTVSRVLNSAPGIAASTAEAVHRAVEAMAYKPTRRRRGAVRSINASAAGQRVGFFIVQHQPGGASVPAYDHLLRGVSNACNDLHLDLQVGFIDSPGELLHRLGRQKLDGLILHGIVPSGEMAEPLTGIPTVWLMGNRKRASWGDQVMPDNGLIGQTAAQFLLRNGHRNVVYHGVNSGWSMSVRSLAFQQAIEDAGGEVTVLNQPPADDIAYVDERARELVATFKNAKSRPTGLFVAEDWLLRSVYAAFAASGLHLGSDIGIISCNNDRPFLLGLSPAPATIDIRFERIAYRGVEQLVNRLARGGNLADRVRIMIEPTLILPAGISSAA